MLNKRNKQICTYDNGTVSYETEHRAYLVNYIETTEL